MLEEILQSGFAAMGISASDSAIAGFRKYYDLLQEKNRVMNLTAISGEDESARLHFLDSASPLLFTALSGCSVIDVGTGAGFPGLPLKILCPDMRLTLLDSLGKRVEFLRQVCGELSLTDTECIHARAEECGPLRESFDFAVSRAVARLNTLCELCLPYVKVGGAFLALKGPAVADELDEAGGAITKLGGQLEQVYEYVIPGIDVSHNVAVIRKVLPTPGKYPRRFAMIKKSPL